MPRLLTIAFVVATAVAACAAPAHLRAATAHAKVRGEPTTVASLDVKAYLGRWYEVYQDFATAATFQQQSYCATADYAALGPQNISVANREHYGSVAGPQSKVSGYAFRRHPTTYPGRLDVVLHGNGATGVAAPYWVLKLGPIVGGQYEYSVVSDNLRFTLFVLARDVRRFEANHAAEVLAWLSRNGFDQLWNTPLKLPQANCTYF